MVSFLLLIKLALISTLSHQTVFITNALIQSDTTPVIIIMNTIALHIFSLIKTGWPL